jgi:hypothetical protein
MDVIRALLNYGQIDVIWVQCSIQLCVVRIHMVLETVVVYYFSYWCGIQCEKIGPKTELWGTPDEHWVTG